ncbi:MAG TPA: BBP7 family outer membrane beta-barrel protein [Lacipirellulaceae bacterium]|nr:BBP7 family outer membrane beta-barrel protein [Lacipirellulaceae bacterium]
MTNSTRLIGLIMTAVLWSGIAIAQPMPGTNLGDDLPPDLTLPSASGEPSPAPNEQATPPSNETAVPSEAEQSAESIENQLPNQPCEPYQPYVPGLLGELAPIESTGTWLRRGFWYAETDAVVFNRMWNRKDKRYAAQDVNVNMPPQNGTSLGFNPVFLDTNRVLILNGALPGEDASVRATLGNFLFRDDHNRDHSLEFTVFGGGSWEQDRELSSATPNGLFVPWFIDGGNRSFDQSTKQSIVYQSALDSSEMNYHVRERLGHDQLIMDPNGQWHRAANAGFEKEYLVGLRFVQMTEKLNWQAQDIVNVGDDGSYIIHTDNDMFGFQLGTGLTWQAPRWSLGATAKGGVFLNDALGRDQLNFTADDTGDADLRLRENALSFVGEFRLLGRYHILPNVSLRAGYEMLFITSAAIAPNQATFITDFSYLNTTANPFYHGASFGCEWYW